MILETFTFRSVQSVSLVNKLKIKFFLKKYREVENYKYGGDNENMIDKNKIKIQLESIQK